jgi:hypothetical protein
VFFTPEARNAKTAMTELSDGSVPIVRISYADVAAWIDSLTPQVPPPRSDSAVLGATS